MRLGAEIKEGQAGFSLVELLVAVAIFTIGILSVNAMQITSINGNSTANRVSRSTNWASDKIERLISLDYDDAALNDTDGDGTNQDGDGDGVDDDDGNGVNTDLDNNGIDDDDDYGLDHVSNNVTMADGWETSPDGEYSVFWNVAVDYPMPGTKTIRIYVTRLEAGRTRLTSLTYIKSDNI